MNRLQEWKRRINATDFPDKQKACDRLDRKWTMKYTCTKNRNYLDTEITVCNKCLKASCWQGEFFCENASSAGTSRFTRKQLFELDTGEHPSYWKSDLEVSAGQPTDWRKGFNN